MFQDLRFALRVLRSRPAFTLAAAVSLALGIGANSAIFGVIDALLLRPLAVPQSSRIVRVFSVIEQDREGGISYPEYLDLRSQTQALTDVVAIGGRGAFFQFGDSRRLVSFNLVSANFFSALRVQPETGQLFSEAARAAGNAPPVVVLGNAAWKKYYGGDPSVIGRQIRIERATDTLYTVIGVLPASFREIENGSDRDFWFPEDCWKYLGSLEELQLRGDRWFRVLARLAPGQSLQPAKAQLSGIAERMAAAYPQSNRGRTFAVVSDLDYRLQQAGGGGLAVLAIVLLVVLISAVNVANLLLSRASVRGKEMAVRLALGASRMRLMSQLMVESLLIGFLGLALGLTLGWWLLALMPSLMVKPPGFDLPNDFEFNSRVLVFSSLVALATTLLFGLVPALRFSRPDLVPALKTDLVYATGARRWPLRNWLVVAEAAIAITLLVCSGMLVRSFANTRTADLGFARNQTLLVWVAADDAKPALYRLIAARYQAMPGVKNVAIAVRAPLSLSSGGMFRRVTFPGRPEYAAAPPFEIKYNAVSPEFLDGMGTPVVRGRGFDQREQSATSDAVVINETMAQRFFAGLDPVGRLIMAGGKPRTIVGVARNAPINAIGETPEPYLYLPYWSNFEGEATFLLNTTGDAAALAQPARQILKQVDARLDPLGITTMDALIRYSAGRYEMAAELVGALSLLGLILTAVGLYGVVSYGVGQRSRELGIRMALGAGSSETQLLVLREVALLGMTGVAIGLPLALVAARLLTSMLFGVSPWDGPTIAAASALLLSVLFVAGWIPARRATAIEPASVLRAG